MTSLHTLLENIVALTKVVQRDRALKPIGQTLARKMATAFRAHRAVFMREFGYRCGLTGEVPRFNPNGCPKDALSPQRKEEARP
jgi:hypothetical protein